MMVNHSTKLRCGRGGRGKLADGLEGIIYLNAFLKLIV
jgi:hypothetical protein